MPRQRGGGAGPAALAAETADFVVRVGRYDAGGERVTLDKGRLRRALASAVTIPSPAASSASLGGGRPRREEGSSVAAARKRGACGGDTMAEVCVFRGGSFEASRWLLTHADDAAGAAAGPTASAAAARGERSAAPPLVLDFASDSNPGGGWRGGQQGTQEEALCRASSLGVALERLFESAGAGGYMPRDGCVYVPDVVVLRDASGALLREPFWVAVVAGTLRGGDADDDAFLRRKVGGITSVAAAHGHTDLVLGAWGSGAFGNDPSLVTRAFAAAVAREPLLKRVVFAVPGKAGKGGNLDAVVRALGPGVRVVGGDT